MMSDFRTKYKCFFNFSILLLIFSCSSGDRDSVEQVDSIPPSSPTSLNATNITQTSLDLSWSPSTDNIGVASYSVYRNNVAITSSTTTLKSISGLTENTAYNFKITARDAVGNVSEFSNILSVTTEVNNSTLQVASGNIETYMGNKIDNVPGDYGNDYTVPTTNQLNTWNLIIDAILAENINVAVEKSSEVNYQITEFTDTSISPNQVFYVLEEKNAQSNYWGTYVFSKTPSAGNLILQAPHIKNDTNTGRQAVYCFKNNVARAVFISGTHRCNNSNSSSCSGTTSTCNSGSEAYRVSDTAHNTQSVFQKTTENIFNSVSNSVFIQLHGFGMQATDPYVIMSNGTRETPTIDYATLIKEALLDEDNSLTFQIAHVNTSWTRLIGFTNTQGRLINNSTDACSASATTTSGRFIHVEQERTKLRDDATGWAKMSNALKSVF
jgi:chitodextrinase